MFTSTELYFAKFPSSVIVEVESGVERAAVFRCRHEVIHAVISWHMSMNGSPSRLYPDHVVGSSFRDSNGTLMDTLTILEYNGTEVVCMTTFFDGSPTIETTSPADLIITGMQTCTIRVLEYNIQ